MVNNIRSLAEKRLREMYFNDAARLLDERDKEKKSWLMKIDEKLIYLTSAPRLYLGKTSHKLQECSCSGSNKILFKATYCSKINYKESLKLKESNVIDLI